MEYVYRLSLPPISTMFKDGIAESVFGPRTSGLYQLLDPSLIIKPECLKFRDMTFNHGMIFYRNKRSKVHQDLGTSQNPHIVTNWGINWIHKGWGTLEFWEYSDFTPEQTHKFIDSQNVEVIWYDDDVPSTKAYTMQADTAYLVNASMPHRAMGYDGRYAVALRDKSMYNLKWEDVVEKFSDLITPWSWGT